MSVEIDMAGNLSGINYLGPVVPRRNCACVPFISKDSPVVQLVQPLPQSMNNPGSILTSNAVCMGLACFDSV